MDTVLLKMQPSTQYGQCRCCLTSGYHKNMMKEYYSNGKREVYYDIFTECFNLFLSSNKSLSTLICGSCIRQLQAAYEFRNKVIESEKQLLATVKTDDTEFITVPTEYTDPVKEVKTELLVIKEEIDDDEYCDNNVMDEDTVEPSHRFDSIIKSKLPPSIDEKLVLGAAKPMPSINEKLEPGTAEPAPSSDLLVPGAAKSTPSIDEELVPGAAELIAKYRAELRMLPKRHMLDTLYPEFVRHLNFFKGQIVTSQLLEKYLNCKEIFRDDSVPSEKFAVLHNASVIVENSNVTPFRNKNRIGYSCFYCKKQLDNLKKIQEHQSENHERKELQGVLGTYGVEAMVVYVDVTNLQCTICTEKIPNIIELKNHLTKIHKKILYTKYPDRVIPFKLSETNIFECQSCGFNFETFGSIERHMSTHYRNFVCKDCGTGFVTKYRLKVHMKGMHADGKFTCEQCKKEFNTVQKLKNHIDTVHELKKRFKCPKCAMRFNEYFQRQKHLEKMHGVAHLEYQCNVCDRSFNRRYTLSRHMKRDHLEERDFQCEVCSYKCFTNNELRGHMVKHSGERIFECSVCKKAYARKKTLREHMRIHNNDRRFSCEVCGQAFVQKCSLKGHIKTHHPNSDAQSTEATRPDVKGVLFEKIAGR